MKDLEQPCREGPSLAPCSSSARQEALKEAVRLNEQRWRTPTLETLYYSQSDWNLNLGETIIRYCVSLQCVPIFFFSNLVPLIDWNYCFSGFFLATEFYSFSIMFTKSAGVKFQPSTGSHWHIKILHFNGSSYIFPTVNPVNFWLKWYTIYYKTCTK